MVESIISKAIGFFRRGRFISKETLQQSRALRDEMMQARDVLNRELKKGQKRADH